MPEDRYVHLIRAQGRESLLTLWDGIAGGETPQWEPGKAFEYLVLRALELDGARVRWPFTVDLGGEVVEQIDGVAYIDGLSCLIESKQTDGPVNVVPIAKLRNQLLRRPGGTIGVVFAYSGFTEPARKLCQYLSPQTVLLWTGEEVHWGLRHGKMVYGLRLKYEHAIEHGLPDRSLLEADL